MNIIIQLLENMAMVGGLIAFVWVTQELVKHFVKFNTELVRSDNDQRTEDSLKLLHARFLGFTCEDAKSHIMAGAGTDVICRKKTKDYIEKLSFILKADRWFAVLYFAGLILIIQNINLNVASSGFYKLLQIMSTLYFLSNLWANDMLIKSLRIYKSHFEKHHKTDSSESECFICDEGNPSLYCRSFYRLTLKASLATVCKIWLATLTLVLLLFSSLSLLV